MKLLLATVHRFLCVFFQNALAINHKETGIMLSPLAVQGSRNSTAAQQVFMPTRSYLPGRATADRRSDFWPS
jgi:hypothetical protein